MTYLDQNKISSLYHGVWCLYDLGPNFFDPIPYLSVPTRSTSGTQGITWSLPSFHSGLCSNVLYQRVLSYYHSICLHYSLYTQLVCVFLALITTWHTTLIYVCCMPSTLECKLYPMKAGTLAIFVFCCVPKEFGIWEGLIKNLMSERMNKYSCE